jgi:hypothetical protein
VGSLPSYSILPLIIIRYINHLKNLKDAQKSINDTLSLASRSIDINIVEYESWYLIPLRKMIKKIELSYKVFRCAGILDLK